MKLNNKTVIIGGLPNPIGGVTTFIRRLANAYADNVIEILDLYPHSNKNIPNELSGKHFQINNKIVMPIKLIQTQIEYKGIDLFFNFSTPKSLVVFLFIPKFRNNWKLMLHHGHLSSHLSNFILKAILNKFDTIYALNDRQIRFYEQIDSSLPVEKETSYVPATLCDIEESKKESLNDSKSRGYKIIIGSGFPRELYQHHLLLEVIERNPKSFLFLFLYGEGELKDALVKLNHPRVKVLVDEDEVVFNYYLANSDLYIRPTLEDSFGIACADAVEFNIPVIASNVCDRYKKVCIYNVQNKSDLFEKSSEILI